jgi:hypothetical protein
MAQLFDRVDGFDLFRCKAEERGSHGVTQPEDPVEHTRRSYTDCDLAYQMLNTFDWKARRIKRSCTQDADRRGDLHPEITHGTGKGPGETEGREK